MLTRPVVILTNVCALIYSMVWSVMVHNNVDLGKGLSVKVWAAITKAIQAALAVLELSPDI